MEYYIASDKGPLGPYSEQQLIERRLRGDEMVWREGLDAWARADTLPELDDVIRAAGMPPVFDRARFDSLNTDGPAVAEPQPQFYYEDDEECPPTYRWLAIISFLGIVPCAIVALVKSVMVRRLWEEGKREEAYRQSRKVLLWAIIGLVIGIPLTIYTFSNGMDNSLMSDGIFGRFYNF